MLKKILLTIMPGSILLTRYYNHLSGKELLAFFIVEISPIVIISVLEGGNVILSLLSFIFLYSLYEIGYYYNDAFSSEKEKNGTKRENLGKDHFVIFLWTRLLIALPLLLLLDYNRPITGQSILLFLALLISYVVHNSVTNSLVRIGSFTILNTAKLLFLFSLLTDNISVYAFAIVPYIYLKIDKYKISKKLISSNSQNIHEQSLPIYFAWMIISGTVSINTLVVFLPYLLVHHAKSIKKTVGMFYTNKNF